jgi:hypothetical protein
METISSDVERMLSRLREAQRPTVEGGEMSTQPIEAEYIAGVIVGVTTHRSGDKWLIEIQPDGSAYTKNIWTKDQAAAYQLSQMQGLHQGFMVNVNVDQQTNKRYMWLAMAGASPPATLPQPQPQMPQQPAAIPVAPPMQPQIPMQPQPVQAQMPQPLPPLPVATVSTQPRVTQDQKEDRIMREAASKVASILISHVPAEQRTLDNVISLSERLVRYYEYGVVTPFGGMQSEEDPGSQGIPHDDSDIPF